MPPKPTGWNRFIANLQGEVSAAELEAFRSASGAVHDLLEQVEQQRLAFRIEGVDPWSVPPATRAVFLCAWNAFVLQTLGDAYLDADYRAEPRTPQFVPPSTAEQVLRFYEPVEGWVSRALQAQANPGYRLAGTVPAPLPAFVGAEKMLPAHLDGLLNAMRAVREHAGAAMDFLPAAPVEPEKRLRLNGIRQLHASAQSRARYAEDLCGMDPAPAVRGRAAEHARAAVSQLYLLGQLVADPELAAGPDAAPAVPRTPSAAAWREAGATGLHLRTRGDAARNQVITETQESVGFTLQLTGEVAFALGLSLVRTPDSQVVALRVRARSVDGYPLVPSGTLTVTADGRSDVLRPLPAHKRRASPARETPWYVEVVAYTLPDGLFSRLCSAPHAGLRFETYRGTADVDADTMERFQSYCRRFHHAVIHPAGIPESGAPA